MEVSMNTVAFSGHRPDSLGGYNILNAYNQRVVSTLQGIIQQLIAQGCRQFICGGALGVDQWAADLVLIEKITKPELELTLALPFEDFDSKWPMCSRQSLMDQIRQATQVHYVCEPGYAGWKLVRRNEWMVDHSDLVVAVWKGIPGGTANCVRYAERQRKSIVYYNPNTTTVIWPAKEDMP
jgi:uncharacterized phage-like protein YoqJ